VCSVDLARKLLKLGYPVAVQYESTWMSEMINHITVLSGYDDAREVFIVEDANWLLGWRTLAYARVVGCRAVVIVPARLAGEVWPLLCASGDVAFAASLELAEDLLSTGDKVSAQLVYEGLPELSERCLSWSEEGQSFCVDNVDRALVHLQDALECPPLALSALGWVDLGDLLVSSRRESDGMLAYEKALELDKSYASALRGMRDLCLKIGRHEHALIYANRLVEASPEDPVVYWGRSLVYEGLGRDKEASSDMERALELEEGNREAAD
jgi:tetratricopeptide (TPR) repeat protein